MNRRDFLKKLGGSMVLLSSGLLGSEWEHGNKNYWGKGIFKQSNIDTSKVETENIVKIYIEGEWKSYKLVELPEKYIDWNLKRRINDIKGIKKGKMPQLSGPHNAAIASYGNKRKDSNFSINNAIKGTGMVPKKEKVGTIIEKIEKTKNNPLPEKLEILQSLYEDRNNWDMRKQLSLELYSQPDFETHSFLNIMEYPIVSIVYLDVPSFELRCAAKMIHPNDKDASQYEKEVVKYTNLIHSYFHGKFSKDFIGMIFHVIEVFDNSPGKMKGIRVKPVLNVK